jgi:hypothetical protein
MTRPGAGSRPRPGRSRATTSTAPPELPGISTTSGHRLDRGHQLLQLRSWRLAPGGAGLQHRPRRRVGPGAVAQGRPGSDQPAMPPCLLAPSALPSGTHHGGDTSVGPFWNAFYGAGADVILNGHEHNYERFGRQDPNARATEAGIRQFVVGTGGGASTDSATPSPTASSARPPPLGSSS